MMQLFTINYDNNKKKQKTTSLWKYIISFLCFQTMYDALRRKLITPINYEKESHERFDSNNNGLRRDHFILPLSSADCEFNIYLTF